MERFIIHTWCTWLETQLSCQVSRPRHYVVFFSLPLAIVLLNVPWPFPFNVHNCFPFSLNAFQRGPFNNLQSFIQLVSHSHHLVHKSEIVSEKLPPVFQHVFMVFMQERCIRAGTLTVNYEKVDVDYRLKHNDLLANIVHR